MADEQAGEKTEQPSGRKLGEAREKGQVPRSGEAGAAVAVLGAAAFLAAAGPAWAQAFMALVPDLLTELRPTPWTNAHAEAFAHHVLRAFVMLAAPPMLVVAVAKIAVNLLQVGVVFSAHPLAPKWEMLNPLNGLKRIFGKGAWVELAKAPIKLVLLGGIAYATIRPAMPDLVLGAGQSISMALGLVSDLVIRLFWRLGAAHLALAALDYLYQRWSHRQGLRMTREEVKEENRQAEGDPLVRSRFRSLHRQYAMRRMMQDVATADVVVTNPTHLAVALKYDAATMRAPKVVAKGARLVAERIRERARSAGVPLVEHKLLARTLYKAVPVGAEVPAALYRIVAEVLAYVWSLGRRRMVSA